MPFFVFQGNMVLLIKNQVIAGLLGGSFFKKSFFKTKKTSLTK